MIEAVVGRTLTCHAGSDQLLPALTGCIPGATCASVRESWTHSRLRVEESRPLAPARCGWSEQYI
jgi:hypothetical protein